MTTTYVGSYNKYTIPHLYTYNMYISIKLFSNNKYNIHMLKQHCFQKINYFSII